MDSECWRAEQEQKFKSWKKEVEHQLRNGIVKIASHCAQAQKAETEEARRFQFSCIRAVMFEMESAITSLDNVQIAYEELRKGCYNDEKP